MRRITPTIRPLVSRDRRVAHWRSRKRKTAAKLNFYFRENWSTELFGDYTPQTMLIRVWMRTAVRKKVTSFGTFLSTLCHEFCHHLDFKKFGFVDSWHTRGFYDRAAALYHCARGTPPKRLFWVAVRGGRWRIDWPRTNRTVPPSKLG